jgi:Acetyltransferase (GNAT) domain
MTDYCPTLNAGLTMLRPLTADHADALFPVLRDVHLWRFTEQEPPKTLAGLRERYQRLESRRSPDGQELWLNWALERREDDRPVGLVQATVPILQSYADIAYVLGRAFWGRGLRSVPSMQCSTSCAWNYTFVPPVPRSIHAIFLRSGSSNGSDSASRMRPIHRVFGSTSRC